MYQLSNGKLYKVFNLFLLPTCNKHNYSTCFATRSTFYPSKARTSYGNYNARFVGPEKIKVISLTFSNNVLL